jgi:hypothetical protein
MVVAIVGVIAIFTKIAKFGLESRDRFSQRMYGVRFVSIL